MTKEYETVESYSISTGRYCIADELIAAGNTRLRSCGSSDAMQIFENCPTEDETYYSAHCYSCCQTFGRTLFHNSSHAAEFGIEGGAVVEKKEFKRLPKAEPLTHEEVKTYIKEIGYVGNNYRGIKDEYSRFFGHLTKLDDNGNVIARYYPETQEGDNWPKGYKCRNHPKDFRYGKLGQTGLISDLSGYIKFKDYVGHRDVLIVGGEEDKVAAFQMLRDNQIRKGQKDYAPVAVVSPTTGEASAIQQIRKQYDWLCGFENIVLGLDNDEAGISAMEEIAAILPKNKVKIAHWTGKDPNKMLQDGKEKQFLSDWYNAKEFVDSGIFASHGLMPYIKDALKMPRIPLPKYMSSLQEKTKGGGVIKNRIYNIVGITSVGKCMAPDTPIMMSDGSIKKVQDVMVGDTVMGADGSARTVLNTNSGTDIMYRIDQVDGMSYTVNSEHILSLRAGYTVDKKSSVRLTQGQICNVKVTDYIKYPANAKRSLKGYKGDLYNLDNGVRIKHPWLLGMWLGDGSSDQATITQSTKATECVDKMMTIASEHSYTTTVAPSRDRDSCKGYHFGNGLRNYLHKHKVINNKHIPVAWKTACYEDRLELLAGLIDSDGYCHNKKGYEITQKSKVLADDIVFLAKSLGFKCSVNLTEKYCQTGGGGIYYRIYISGQVHKLSKHIALTYKKIEENDLSKLRELHNTAITVTEVGVGQYYGFEVDGDHLFCLGDFTVTHNSTHSNNMVYSFAFLPNEKTAVISLEATKGEYGVDILSLHLETNLYWQEADAVQEYLDSPEVQKLANELFVDENGESRFYVVDDRKGTIKSLETLCETLRCKYGVTIIVIDVLTDLLRVSPKEDQDAHLNWQSNFVKNGVTIFNVLHTRKIDNHKDGRPRKATEFDALGSSLFCQKAAGTIVINRNKECPDDDWIERNTTYVDVPKMRQGATGQAGAWYYDPDTRQCYDREKFFKDNPEKLPEGYDLSVSSFDKEYYEEGGRGYKKENQERGYRKEKTGFQIEPDIMENPNLF